MPQSVAKLHVAALLLLVAGLLCMYHACYQWLYASAAVPSMAESLAAVLFTLNPTEDIGPRMEASVFYINEDRAAVFLYAVALILFIASAVLAFVHRVRSGRSRLFVPLAFAAFVGCMCALSLTYDTGVFYGT